MAQTIIETEETLIIETPERVPLAFALASIGNRFIAVAIDHFIQYFAIFLVAWAFMSAAGIGGNADEGTFNQIMSEMPKWTVAILIIVIFLLFSGYFIFFEWLMNGQTPGQASVETARHPRRRSPDHALGSDCAKSSADFRCRSGFCRSRLFGRSDLDFYEQTRSANRRSFCRNGRHPRTH